MTGLAIKLILSALPFFKEMIFGRKTKTEKVTGIAMFFCFLITILFMIIVNSFNHNLGLNKKNKDLMDENKTLYATIETLKGSKILGSCPDSRFLLNDLQTKLAKKDKELETCMETKPTDNNRVKNVKGALDEME